MRAKKGFNLREVCGEQIIVAEGRENIDFTNIISMNESSAYLWQKVAETEFDEDTLTHLLVEEYEVSDEQARADVKQLMQKWLEAGIVEA